MPRWTCLLAAALVLTSVENGTVPQTEFLCSGKIHGYIRLPSSYIGRHTLEATWTKPNGKVAAHSRDVVNFPEPGRSTVYIWFAFPEKSAVPGAVDPALDEERTTFPGCWKVNVQWDDQPLVQSTFTVRCL